MSDTLAPTNSVLAVDRTKLEHAKSAGAQALAKLMAYPCTTPAQEQQLADFMNRAHVIVQDLESERETMVRPLIDSKAEVDGLFKEARTPWEQVKKLCKSKIEESQTARRREQEAARQKVIAAAQAGDTASAVQALATLQGPAMETSKPAGAGVSFEWVALIENANEIPREFLEVSATKINAYAKQYQKQETIPAVPGLKFERRAKVGVK